MKARKRADGTKKPMKRRSRAEAASEVMEAEIRNVPEELQAIFRARFMLHRGSKRKAPWESFLEWAASDQGQFEINEFRASKVPSEREMAAAEARHHGIAGDLPTLRRELRELQKARARDLAAARTTCAKELSPARERAQKAREAAGKTKASLGARCDAALDQGYSPSAARRLCNLAYAETRTALQREGATAQATLASARAQCRVRHAKTLAEHAPAILDKLAQIEWLERTPTHRPNTTARRRGSRSAEPF